MMNFIMNVLSVISNIISELGYWGIGLGMLIESACIPLPSELVLPIGGFLAADGVITLVGANIAVNIGSMVGSYIAYFVGYFGGRTFILKYGKYFFVSKDHFYHAEKSFNKFGASAVFFGRLLPVIRTFISLPAGMARMDIKKFSMYSLLGMIPWNFALIYLGYIFKENYETIVRPYFKNFEHIVVGLIILIILVILFKYLLKRKKSSVHS